MNIILLNLAGDTQYNELVEWITPAIEGRLFSARGEIKNINLIGVKEKDSNAIEYIGFVRIEPEVLALRAIEKLNGQVFKERLITVRQYNRRNWYYDQWDKITGKAVDSTGKLEMHNRRRNLETLGTPFFPCNILADN